MDRASEMRRLTRLWRSSTSESGKRQAELAREGFETALENVRQLAEIAADSQSKAVEIMRERFEANMQAMLNQGARSDD